ncbi:hypothetical protein [Lichenibacterium ramalinae]|uniref:hypothetical protein n=1 Tax=Lichenibacterium ramalinae TaxID=2316527 RepID=UPI0013ED7FD9|nr:hypothetical protein [Lichenibacterium ramalinae]
MLLVATTPFSGLLELFVAVPLGIVCSIYGTEYASTLRGRRRRQRRSHPGDGHGQA